MSAEHVNALKVLGGVLALLAAVALFTALLSGCEGLRSAKVTPGSAHGKITEGVDPATGLPVTSKEITVTTPGYSGPGEGTKDIDITTPDLTLNGGVSSRGGTAGFSTKTIAGKSIGGLYFFGAVCIIGGFIAARFSPIGWGAVGGGTFIILLAFFATEYPFLVFVAFAAIVAGGGVLLYKAYRAAQVKRTLTAVVKTVEKEGGDTLAKVKAGMNKLAVPGAEDIVKEITKV
jgi:hypothetical protein